MSHPSPLPPAAPRFDAPIFLCPSAAGTRRPAPLRLALSSPAAPPCAHRCRLGPLLFCPITCEPHREDVVTRGQEQRQEQAGRGSPRARRARRAESAPALGSLLAAVRRLRHPPLTTHHISRGSSSPRTRLGPPLASPTWQLCLALSIGLSRPALCIRAAASLPIGLDSGRSAPPCRRRLPPARQRCRRAKWRSACSSSRAAASLRAPARPACSWRRAARRPRCCSCFCSRCACLPMCVCVGAPGGENAAEWSAALPVRARLRSSSLAAAWLALLQPAGCAGLSWTWPAAGLQQPPPPLLRRSPL